MRSSKFHRRLQSNARHFKRILATVIILFAAQSLTQMSKAEIQQLQPNEQPKPFRFIINYLAQPIVNPAGGLTSELSWLNSLWLQLELGLGLNLEQEQWKEIDHWVIKLETALVRGNSDYYEQVGAEYPLQSLTSSGQWLSEVSVRRLGGNSGIGVKAGIFSLNPGFMESEVFNYYIHSAINNTFNNEVLAIPIAPLTSFGVQVNLAQPSTHPSHQLSIGAFSVVPTNTFGKSVEPGSTPLNLQGAIGLLQWQYGFTNDDQPEVKQIQNETQSVPDVLPEPGVMIGGYWSETTAKITPTQAEIPIPDGLNRGIYATTTLKIPSTHAIGMHSRAWVAGHYGFDWNNNPAPISWGIGLLLQGLLPGRPLDVTGFAGGSTGFSPSINPGQYQESLLEINHQIQISSRLSLKPFAQLIITPSGIPSSPSILATGLQAAIQF